jgi:hypothetical protein
MNKEYIKYHMVPLDSNQKLLETIDTKMNKIKRSRKKPEEKVLLFNNQLQNLMTNLPENPKNIEMPVELLYKPLTKNNNKNTKNKIKKKNIKKNKIKRKLKRINENFITKREKKDFNNIKTIDNTVIPELDDKFVTKRDKTIKNKSVINNVTIIKEPIKINETIKEHVPENLITMTENYTPVGIKIKKSNIKESIPENLITMTENYTPATIKIKKSRLTHIRKAKLKNELIKTNDFKNKYNNKKIEEDSESKELNKRFKKSKTDLIKNTDFLPLEDEYYFKKTFPQDNLQLSAKSLDSKDVKKVINKAKTQALALSLQNKNDEFDKRRNLKDDYQELNDTIPWKSGVNY